MAGYILSILGIVIAGVFIDIIVPNGTINKYIKGIYSIFVVAVLIAPIVKLLAKKDVYTLSYQDYEINEKLLNYINQQKINNIQNTIKNTLTENGFQGVDIKLNFSLNSNEITINSCEVNLKNLVISADKQNINKYEFIGGVIKQNTNLADEVIIYYE